MKKIGSGQSLVRLGNSQLDTVKVKENYDIEWSDLDSYVFI